MTETSLNHEHALGVAGGLVLAAGVGIIALLWLFRWRGNNPLTQANRIIESLNEKIGELEGQVQTLHPAR